MSTIDDVAKFIETIKNQEELNQKGLSLNQEEESLTNKEGFSNININIEPYFPSSFRFSSWPEQEKNLRKDMIGFIERFFYENKKLPVKEDFELRFPKKDLPRTIDGWKELLISLREPLEARGLPFFHISDNYLDPEFVAATSLIVNFHDKRSIGAKLKELGLTTKRWNAWMRISKFREYYESRLNEVVDEDTENMAKISLNQLIANGDLQAIKFMYEVRNVYRPQNNSNTNLLLILQSIMEILAKYVEKDVLNSIATELRSSTIIAGELNPG